MTRINDFLLAHDLRISANPCISPDFCLDWPALAAKARQAERSALTEHHASILAIGQGTLRLLEDPATGDCCWLARGCALPGFTEGVACADGAQAFPATWGNLLALKNILQTADPASTVFPSAAGDLPQRSLGVGARFTTLHWPAVDWAMAHLGLSMNANQNSIPRELVYDVDAMLGDRLMKVRFPFIGADVPEGHQGQSVEGMSHGAVLAKLKDGFHRRRLPWGFNADHQPIGGVFDAREEALVRGSLLATSITFDLSPELMATALKEGDGSGITTRIATIPVELVKTVEQRLAAIGLRPSPLERDRLLATVWPAMQKMQRRDRLYAEARAKVFSTEIGRTYLRELSIDELPGLTSPETLAIMLALAEAMGMPAHFVAPAFGFQKNFPFDDQAELERRIGGAWAVCRHFGVSIGFHSGSGKSADNYRCCGRITGGRLEIKTSGRYTYEMGVALSQSPQQVDRTLWQDWYGFTRELAISSAFSADATERSMARTFIEHALRRDGKPVDVFADAARCRAALQTLDPSPDHMFFFEYNFLFILAGGGVADKARLGDHGPDGYRQRARFYAISDQAKLAYTRRVAEYLIFLAETTGLASPATCASARTRLASYCCLRALSSDIG